MSRSGDDDPRRFWFGTGLISLGAGALGKKTINCFKDAVGVANEVAEPLNDEI